MRRISILSLSLCLATSSFATTWTVDDFGKADFNSIQQAIDASSNGDTILVYSGIYLEAINFNGKLISVEGESASSTTINGADNASSVVTFENNEDATSSISGFRITGGTGNMFTDPIFGPAKGGGGIFCDSASPTITDCVIEGNSTWGGGAIFVYYCAPTISNCTIRDNEAEGHGGGIYAFENADVTITDTTFENNTANWGGGVTCHEHTDATFTNCTFVMNTTLNVGGGVYIRSRSNPNFVSCAFSQNEQINNPLGSGGGVCVYGGGDTGGPCYPTFTDCLFSSNTVNGDGGGMSVAYRCDPILINCTFENNHAGRSGGGLACVADAAHTYPSNADVQNCIFENNSATEEGGGIHVRNSDPTFNSIVVTSNVANPSGGGLNFYESTDAQLINSRICGNSASQINGNFTDGGGNIIDDVCTLCEGDTNEDGVVDVTDILAAVDSWGPCSGCAEDIDGNGVVDVTDLLIIVGNWGSCE